MLPPTIWVGPFCTRPIIRLGGSGWITALMTPPAFGSWASAAAVMLHAATTPNTTRFNICSLSCRSALFDEIRIGPLQHALERGPFAVRLSRNFDRIIGVRILLGGLAGDALRELADFGPRRLNGELGAAGALQIVHQ